jgi:hypothetical protein
VRDRATGRTARPPVTRHWKGTTPAMTEQTTVVLSDLEAAAVHAAAAAQLRQLKSPAAATDPTLVGMTDIEVAALRQGLDKLETAHAGRPCEPRWLRDTEVRVIAVWHDPDTAMEGTDDPYQAWVVLPSWRTRRAVLVAASPLVTAVDHDEFVNGLSGVPFRADLPEPADEPVEGERIEFIAVRVAEQGQR